MEFFAEWYVLAESKQVIVNMGYPPIISSLLYERFGKTAPLIAKWYKEDATQSDPGNPDWWRIFKWKPTQRASLYELTYMYEATKDPQSYIQAAEKMDQDIRRYTIDDTFLAQTRDRLVARIKDEFFNELFFHSNSIVQDIMDGRLTDLAPYKRLPFAEAQHLYESKRIFNDTQPFKVYPDGFKWINVGKKSTVLATAMKNCGNVGLMSIDPNAVIFALFGPTNVPHVMVTYSREYNKVSGEEGVASSPVKEKYHDYILDLCRSLGATLDADKSKSSLLAIRAHLGDRLHAIEPVGDSGGVYKVQLGNEVYYTNRYTAISARDVARVEALLQSGGVKLGRQGRDLLQTIFLNTSELNAKGIPFVPMRDLGMPVA